VFDMAKWDAALYTDKLIKRSTLDQMWTPVKLNNGTTYPYGFAWRTREENGHRIIQHDGVDVAYTTRIARYVNDRLSIVVFLNLGEDEEALMPTRMTDSVAELYLPTLGNHKSQEPLTSSARMLNLPASDIKPISSEEKEVWNGELNYYRNLHARDLKNFMSLWDDRFVGWPDYSQHPVQKAEIESSVAEEIQSGQTSSRPLPPPQPEAIAIFGDVAVTHYYWPEADKNSPFKYRITHTWQNGTNGWHIVGGMSCEAPRTAAITGSASFQGDHLCAPRWPVY